MTASPASADALPAGLVLAYYGDDFTGSTDTMEAFTAAGVPTVLLLETPDATLLARFPGMRCVGMAGHSRGRDPRWMDDKLAPALAALARLGAPILQYKVCSTFDSSPATGSIGHAIDLGVALMPGDWSPMVVGAPRLGRYQAFGNLFAAFDGEGFRLDRHPTMSRHPVTPMNEADLLRHLGAQTRRPLALVDFARMKAGRGDQTLARHRDADAGSPPVVLLDVIDEETLREAGRLVWSHRGAGVFSASSSGLQYALAAWWRHAGLLPPPAPLPAAAAVDRIAVVSGSCSPVTAGQITCAGQQGFALLRLDLPALLATGRREIVRLTDAACAVLAEGRSPLVHSASGPDDPAVAGFDALTARAGLSRAAGAARIGEALAEVMHGVLARTPALRRIAVAGGDSSGDVAASLGIRALTVTAGLSPGAPLCRAWSDDPGRDGLQIALKGGQMGGPDFFRQVRDGTSAAAVT